jgi:hypothetical protein
MKFIAQSALDNAVLFKLFVHAQTSDERLDKEGIANLFEIPISPRRVELALDNLERRDYVSRWAANGSCSIQVPGYRVVEEQLGAVDSFMSQYANAGDDWLSRQTVGVLGIPAADRIVSRKDNQEVVQEIEETIDQIEDELLKNNEVGAELGEERDMIAAELEASKTLTKAGSFRLVRLISLLAPALKFLGDKFGGGLIGDLAKRLLQLLLDLI